jgi:hypothetical protein
VLASCFPRRVDYRIGRDIDNLSGASRLWTSTKPSSLAAAPAETARSESLGTRPPAGNREPAQHALPGRPTPQPASAARLLPGASYIFDAMRFAVAVVSFPGYVHSEAFREAAQAVHHALLALGHDSVLTNRVDSENRRTIVLGSNLLPALGLKPPENTILYNLEQVYDNSPWMTPELLALFRRYPVWDYSQANIERLTALQVPQLTHVPIGYVPELKRITPACEDIDVLFYGTRNDRRDAVLNKLYARGLRVESLFSVYGPDRDAWIARSKIVLNMHHYEAQVFEIVRVSCQLEVGAVNINSPPPTCPRPSGPDTGPVPITRAKWGQNRCRIGEFPR